MSTEVHVMPPVVGALKSAIEFENQARTPWRGIIPAQKEFLTETYFPYMERKFLSLFSPEEMKYIASFSADEINKFLEENKFSIRLDPFTSETDFGAASVMDISVKWVEEAERTTMFVDKNGKETNYPAIKIKDYFETFMIDGIQFAEIHLKYESKDRMILAKGPFNSQTAKNPLKLYSKTLVTNKDKKTRNGFSSLVIPKINLDCESDLSFLLGMQFDGVVSSTQEPATFCVSQALQQTKFKLNEFGARARSAAAVAVLRCATVRKEMVPPLVFDEPFMLWLIRTDEKTGDEVVYFASYLDIDVWKESGSLDDM